MDGKFDFIALVKIFSSLVGAATVGFLNKDSFKMYKILEKPWFTSSSISNSMDYIIYHGFSSL